MLPKQLPVRIDSRKDTLRPLHKHVSRLRIHRRARSGVALINRITQEIIVQTMPEFFAGFGVEASNAFLEIRPVTYITHDVEFAIGNDCSGLAGKISHP